jgi:hypothetical protein
MGPSQIYIHGQSLLSSIQKWIYSLDSIFVRDFAMSSSIDFDMWNKTITSTSEKGGSGEGKRNSRVRTVEVFSQDDTRFQTTLFMLYITYWGEGVSLQDTSDHHEGVPRSTRPWVDTCDVQVSKTWRLLPHTEDSEGTDAHRDRFCETYYL